MKFLHFASINRDIFLNRNPVLFVVITRDNAALEMSTARGGPPLCPLVRYCLELILENPTDSLTMRGKSSRTLSVSLSPVTQSANILRNTKWLFVASFEMSECKESFAITQKGSAAL